MLWFLAFTADVALAKRKLTFSLMPERHKPNTWAKFNLQALWTVTKCTSGQKWHIPENIFFFFVVVVLCLFKQWSCRSKWEMTARFGPGCIIQHTTLGGKLPHQVCSLAGRGNKCTNAERITIPLFAWKAKKSAILIINTKILLCSLISFWLIWDSAEQP